MTTIQIPTSDSAVSRRTNGEPCVVCGREVKSPRYYLEVVQGGGVAAMPGSADERDAGYIGALPVGPDCLRRHPALKPFAVDVQEAKEKNARCAGGAGKRQTEEEMFREWSEMSDTERFGSYGYGVA